MDSRLRGNDAFIYATTPPTRFDSKKILFSYMKLEAIRLSKRYKKRWVVNQVSLSIEAGKIVGLLGPNGAGKTSCFYLLVGLIQSDQGKILLGQEDITHLPIHLRAQKGIGYLPQEPSIFRKLTVSENILAILELRKSLSEAERYRELENLLREFHISHLKDHLGITLSGGERRRVEIARSLAVNPRFILLDEPFAGIDPISVLDIEGIIKHLSKRGIGVLITDHNVRAALKICHNAYIMNEGLVICEGSPQEILQHTKVREVYLGHEFSL
jgi:lipopolysaccharide export system ATP-binding protein